MIERSQASALAVLLVACDSAVIGPTSGALDASDGASAADVAPRIDASDGDVDSTRLGANVEHDGVMFRVWAPHASSASVSGDFATDAVIMKAAAGGVFEARVASAQVGSAYHFSLTTPEGVLTRLDPYCRQLQGSTNCVVIDPKRYTWSDATFAAPSRNTSIVYEMHIGSFAAGTPVCTFATAREKLPSLAELGVNVIELMPVQDFGGTNGWGYNPHLYFAPNASYGTADDLREFVNEAHRLGIAVWLDTVVNHADGSKRAPLMCFDAPCPSQSGGLYFFPAGQYALTPWGPRPNYSEPQVTAMLVAAADAWMDEFHGDGFRWDSTSNIRAIDGAGMVPNGKEFLVTANDHIHARGKFSVAEDLKGYEPLTAAKSAGGFGFDAQWEGFGYTIVNQVVVDDDARDLTALSSGLRSAYNGDSFARVFYTENHDTVGNGGARLPSKIDPANPTSWTAKKRSMLANVLLLTAPGLPMLFQGQEALATGTFSSSPQPLAAPTPAGMKIRAFFKDLIRLRRNLDGKSGGLLDSSVEVFHQNDSAKVLAYRRYGSSGQDVIVIVNLRNKAYTTYDIGVSDAGPWTIRLNIDASSYGDDFIKGQTGSLTASKATKDNKPYTLSLQLPAYGAIVLSH